MGELHLEVIVDRMMREFKVEANVGKPQVAYRETVRKRAEKVVARFVRQTEAAVSSVTLHQPGTGREGFDFESKIKRRSNPLGIYRPDDKGISGGDGERRQGGLPDGRRQS